MKKPFYKKWWFVVIVVIIVLGILGSALGLGNDDKKKDKDSTPAQSEQVNTEKPEKVDDKKEPEVSAEFKSALKKAKSYSETMHMSKQGIYDQLTSEYGEKFPAEAAQYAVDNLKADYKKNALEKAKDYRDTMDMSTESIRDQLTSEYGEKFTQEEADYAIANLPQ
ncbi:Ltp family lipoprotein [Anaerovoracaceae bacterium SGI.195]